MAKDELSCIADATFIAVDNAGGIGKDKFSGIVGLSPFQAEASNVPAFITQGENVFSFYLSKGSGSTGTIVLGGYDLDQFAASGTTEQDISWTALVDESWTIPMNLLMVKGEDKELPLKSTQVMLDSGLSYSMVPQEDITTIENSLSTQGIVC